MIERRLPGKPIEDENEDDYDTRHGAPSQLLDSSSYLLYDHPWTLTMKSASYVY
jgi:hypothetical protein